MMLSKGQFQEVLENANQLLIRVGNKLDRATCFFLIGVALKELGRRDQALPYLLEASITFSLDDSFLVGHAQMEVAEIQTQNSMNGSALFFIDMAITNFNLKEEQVGTEEIKKECQKLKQDILQKLNH